MDANTAISRVFGLYERHGQNNYVGEPVTQLEHAVQCAMRAETDGASTEEVVGALLHDVGHILAIDRALPVMVTGDCKLGGQNHEKLGGQYLRELGFPERVWKIAEGHVNAKRYLVYKDKAYHNRLSAASKMTLVHQGGPMTSQEADDFERSAEFGIILRMRTWDEQAKVNGLQLEPIEKYRQMCFNLFQY